MPLIEEPDHTQKRSKRRKPPTLDALLNDIAAPAPEPELTPERTRAEMYARQQITNQHQTTMRDDVDQNRAADAAEAPTPGGWANPFAPIITTGFQHTSSTAPAIQMHDCVTVAIPMRDVAELLADLAPLIAPATRKTPLPRQAMKLINNMVLFQNVVALAEALALIGHAGIDPELAFETLAKGSADSFALRNPGMKAMLKGD